MTSHLGVMILFSAAVAVVFSTLLRDDVHEALRLGARIFSGLVVGAFVVGWLMYFIAP
jgi:hypothetical protein